MTSAPSGATIFLDNVGTGKVTPYTFTDVPVGDHVVNVTLGGYPTQFATTVEVERGEMATVHFRLKSDAPNTGSIKVTSAPPGATIFLDKVNTGKLTPYTLTDVPVGNHMVYVTLSGYPGPGATTVKVERGKKENVHFKLKTKTYLLLQ